MDIKEMIEQVVGSVTKDNSALENFKKDPIATVKSLLGSIDLDNDVISKIVEGVKAKISLDNLSGIAGKIGGLFK